MMPGGLGRVVTGMLALVVLLGAVRGMTAIYHAGERSAEARQAQARAVAEARLRRLAADVAAAEAERLAGEEARDERARAIDEAGRGDPDAGRPALGIGSVRRLNLR